MRHDLHRNVARRRVKLELVQNRPAEHVGQKDVERNCRGSKLTSERQTDAALRRDDAFEVMLASQTEQDTCVVRIIFDDQKHSVARLDGIAIIGDAFFART